MTNFELDLTPERTENFARNPNDPDDGLLETQSISKADKNQENLGDNNAASAGSDMPQEEGN